MRQDGKPGDGPDFSLGHFLAGLDNKAPPATSVDPGQGIADHIADHPGSGQVQSMTLDQIQALTIPEIERRLIPASVAVPSHVL